MMGTQGSTDGRNHWPQVMSMCLAGGGLRHGQVIGATETDGGNIRERPVTPGDLAATIFRYFDVPLDTSYLDNQGRPRVVVENDGQPIAELFLAHRRSGLGSELEIDRLVAAFDFLSQRGVAVVFGGHELGFGSLAGAFGFGGRREDGDLVLADRRADLVHGVAEDVVAVLIGSGDGRAALFVFEANGDLRQGFAV